MTSKLLLSLVQCAARLGTYTSAQQKEIRIGVDRVLEQYGVTESERPEAYSHWDTMVMVGNEPPNGGIPIPILYTRVTIAMLILLTCGADMENRTARLTILIDPRKKKIFEDICAAHDVTPSQVVRKLIRQYILENAAGRTLPAWLENGRGTEK